MEVWKDVVGYEGYYQVSNMGRVKNKKEKIMVLGNGKNGYIQVSLYKTKKSSTKKVHRLVAKTFVPNPQNKKEVNHINGKKNDNRDVNLEWCTRKENVNHAIKTGLMKSIETIYNNRKKIVMLSLNDEPLLIFNSITEATKAIKGKEYKKWQENQIGNCARGLADTGFGYKWKYE